MRLWLPPSLQVSDLHRKKFEHPATDTRTPGLFNDVAYAKPASSTFILGYGDGQNLTFALNIPYNSHDGDLYFHLSAPSSYSWAAVRCMDRL
jgi:hypothetical protein